MIDFLPSRLAADLLIKHYFISVHPICQLLHRPTFENEYDVFWDGISLGIEPPVSVQSIVFAVMFSGVASMDEDSVIREFGVSVLNPCHHSLVYHYNSRYETLREMRTRDINYADNNRSQNQA